MAGALFLDRDGVINAKAPEGRYIEDAAGFRLLPGVGEALAAIRAAVPGLRIGVVTNQRGVARGRLSVETLAAIHERLQADIARAGARVDRIESCIHDEGLCDCRKPGIGLFERLLHDWPEVTAAESAVVGDSAIDIIAGRRVGARTYLVGPSGRREREAELARRSGAPADEESGSLPELVARGRLASWLRDGRVG